MLFNSFHFLLYFPLVVFIYFTIPSRFQLQWLLLASCYFYAVYKPIYLFILILVIFFDFFAAQFIEKSPKKTKHFILFLSLAGNLGLLFYFKYYNFITVNILFLESIFHFSTRTSQILDVALPIGLSFHTFQSMGYVIDVTHGKTPAERNILKYATFVLFFPQLVAGPIERASNLLHQFQTQHRPNVENIKSGIYLMMWGFMKKIVIADRLAPVVNITFSDPQQQTGPQLLFSLYAFSLQIYGDFSGYTDIARGCAKILGYDLMINFKRPLFSSSPQDFWRRWHISLSTWFRDYVYLPLGGNRQSRLRTCFNLLAVFSLSGLWHGPRWNFVFWGLYHGILIVIEKYFSTFLNFKFSFKINISAAFQNGIKKLICIHLIALGWVLFRVNTLTDAITYYRGIFRNWSMSGLSEITALWELAGLYKKEFVILFIALILLLSVEFLQEKGVSISKQWKSIPPSIRMASYIAFCFFLFCFGKYDQHEFIYFRF